MQQQPTLITNVGALLPGQTEIASWDIKITGNKISNICFGNSADKTGCMWIDGKNRILVPGKIHPHVNLPWSISDQQIRLLSQSLLLSGITSFIGIPSSNDGNLDKVLEKECLTNFSTFYIANTQEAHRLIEVDPLLYAGIFLEDPVDEGNLDYILANIRGCPIAMTLLNDNISKVRLELAKKHEVSIQQISAGSFILRYFDTQRLYQQFKNKKKELLEIVYETAGKPADEFCIKKRGKIAEGYVADLNLIHIDDQSYQAPSKAPYSGCWNSNHEEKLNARITHTWVNGVLVAKNGNIINESQKGQKLLFSRI